MREQSIAVQRLEQRDLLDLHLKMTSLILEPLLVTQLHSPSFHSSGAIQPQIPLVSFYPVDTYPKLMVPRQALPQFSAPRLPR